MCVLVLGADAQLDPVAGLMLMREGLPLDLYCTPSVGEELSTSFPLLDVLSFWRGGYRRIALPESSHTLFRVPFLSTLECRVVPLQSNAPPYSPRRHRPQPGDNIGLFVRDTATKRSLFYAPGLGEMTSEVEGFMAQADCLLVDGTFWTDEEIGIVGLQGGHGRGAGEGAA